MIAATVHAIHHSTLMTVKELRTALDCVAHQHRVNVYATKPQRRHGVEVAYLRHRFFFFFATDFFLIGRVNFSVLTDRTGSTSPCGILD